MPEDAVYKEGAVIYFERDPADRIFIIRSGMVELTRELGGVPARTIATGEILGLAETLSGHARIASARAVTAVSATAVTADEFRGILAGNFAIGQKLLTGLSSELRDIDEVIVKQMRGGMAQSMGHGVGLRMIADHFRAKGMNRAARYAYGQYLLDAPPGEDRLTATLNLAALCEKDGEHEIALQIYESLCAAHPEDPRPQTAYHRLRSVLEAFGGGERT